MLESVIESCDYFHYTIGKVSTNKSFRNPTYKSVKEFFQCIKDNTNIFEKYKLQIIGGCLYDFSETVDLDIALIGDILSYEDLENDMNRLYDVAFNVFRLKIDIQWLDAEDEIITYHQLNLYKIKNILFKNNLGYYYVNPKKQEQYLIKSRTFIKIGYLEYQINNQLTIKDYRHRYKKLTEFLITGIYPTYNNKKLSYVSNNPNRTIKPFFDAETLLHTDEQYYRDNSNFGAKSYKLGLNNRGEQS